jgi:hypothetical protein
VLQIQPKQPAVHIQAVLLSTKHWKVLAADNKGKSMPPLVQTTHSKAHHRAVQYATT